MKAVKITVHHCGDILFHCDYTQAGRTMSSGKETDRQTNKQTHSNIICH